MGKSAPHLIAAGISLVVLIFFLCGVGVRSRRLPLDRIAAFN